MATPGNPGVNPLTDKWPGIGISSSSICRARVGQGPFLPITDEKPMAEASCKLATSRLPASAAPGLLWQTARREAESLAAREPVLRPMLDAQLLFPPDGKAIIARLLSARLAVTDTAPDALFELIAGVLDEQENLLPAIEADLAAVKARDPACATLLHALLNLKGFHGLQTYRIAHALWQHGRSELALWLSNLASLVFGPDIHPAARIGRAIMLDHGSGIVIGETAVVEDGVSLLQNVTLGGTGKETGDRHPKIRRGVMIGAGAKILGNIEIGAFSKIAAGSVVLKPVPAHCTAAGVPATVVRIHRADEIPAESMEQQF